MISMIKFLAGKLFPHSLRQVIKRRCLVVRDSYSRLTNLKCAGFHPTAAVDGGAFKGDWALEFWSVWERVPLLIVEPQPSQMECLCKLASKVSGSEVVAVALGARTGTVAFHLGGSNSGVASLCDFSRSVLQIEMRTLDEIVSGWQAGPPNFLKLDLQGHELEALRGATVILPGIEVILMEVSVLKLGEVPVFHEVEEFMTGIGFRLYDVIPQYYRPRDGALWQIDALYVRETSSLFSSRSWD